MPTPTLPEVREADAAGSVAATYADIRRVLAVEMVVLYYRVLAAVPGRLERVWAAVAPNLASVAGRAAATSLRPRGAGPAAELPAGALRRAGLDPPAVRDTVEAFDRANRLNVVALSALLHGAPGEHTADGSPAPPLDPLPSLPLADLGALEPSTRALLERLSAPVAGDERPLLVPSMLRVFAVDRAALETLGACLGPVVEDAGFAAAVDDLVDQARAAAAGLPFAVAAEADPATREVTARFVRTIAAMIVVCGVVRDALAAGGA